MCIHTHVRMHASMYICIHKYTSVVRRSLSPASIKRRRVSSTAVGLGSVACMVADGLCLSTGKTFDPLPLPTSRTWMPCALSSGNSSSNARRSLKNGVGASTCLWKCFSQPLIWPVVSFSAQRMPALGPANAATAVEALRCCSRNIGSARSRSSSQSKSRDSWKCTAISWRAMGRRYSVCYLIWREL